MPDSFWETGSMQTGAVIASNGEYWTKVWAVVPGRLSRGDFAVEKIPVEFWREGV